MFGASEVHLEKIDSDGFDVVRAHSGYLLHDNLFLSYTKSGHVHLDHHD